MENPGRYFYRCFSDCSAGGLVSGKGRRHTRLSNNELHTEFFNHVLSPTKKSTALISVSSRIIDTLRRAFGKFHKDREKPDQIWIAFVHVPDEDEHVYHHAEDLAYQANDHNPRRFRYEYLFEWEIPQRYLMHKVSVATLLQRGFSMKKYLVNKKLPRTSILREQFARLLHPTYGGHYTGLELGLLVRAFGARAPLFQIALQIQADCTWIDEDCQLVRVSYGNGQFDCLEFDHFRVIQDGVDTILIDGWLTDSQFLDRYEEHRSWAWQVEAEVEDKWGLPLKTDIDYEQYKRDEQYAIAQIEEAAIKLGL